MATTDAPLKRLFERLDFAPKPRADALDAILEHWQSKRGDALFPRTRDFAIADLRAGRAEAFIFSIADREEGYQLAAGSPGLTRLLGPIRGGEGLNAASNRRSAARLRRLFEVVRNTGGPLTAEFTTDDVEGGKSVEILVASLSSDGRNVTGVLGG